ncbi:MAG: T9SS type A sorting domain-containing protein [Bacteroidia bacterium]|nr:T9SS type A sorting domain-containing protein [Bacteroidia bacterium]
MKKHLLLLLLCLFSFPALQLKSQTTLAPGDVAIVQVNYSYNSFDFVCLVDIEAGTKIRFTDYAYSTTLSDLDQTTTSDGIYEYTAPSTVSAGKVIQYRVNSDINPAFQTIAGSSLSLRSYKNSYTLAGENILVYQQNNDIKTFVFAMGWMRKDNFSINPLNTNAKVCGIPQGLSKSNFTVIQIDSVMKPGQNPQLARDFRYNKYDGFTGTAFMLRRYLSSALNYNTFSGAYDNNAVEDFTVLAPDNTAPVLTSSYPTNNKINVSVNSGVELIFDEKIEVLKPLLIRNTANESTIIVTTDEIAVVDSILSFSFDKRLENAGTYVLEIPQAAIRDLNGNTWPANSNSINFATSAKRSNIAIDFSAPKENLKWTTQSAVADYEGFYLFGYWSFSMNNLPMRWYVNEHGETVNSIPASPGSGNDMFIGGMNNSRLVIDVSAINNTITNIDSYVYDNNCQIVTSVYSNGNVVKSKKVTNSINSPFTINEQHYVKQYIANDNDVKIDSVVFASPEGRVFKTNFELIDLMAPVVEFGDARVLCEGDSTQLDAGYTPGAVYAWSTNESTQKIWVKTSNTYSVTVKNTLGEMSDNVLVTVKPKISLSLPDTIYACVGDTVTLTAGANTENSYLWSPGGQTTPSIQVAQSGIYHVLVSNGAGGCLSTDSTRVIFKGARLNATFLQGGMTGFEDVQGELYKKNNAGKFELLRAANMPQLVFFEELPAGDYILKAHFVSWTFPGENPFVDTYHDQKVLWSDVKPFKLTCESDTMLMFLLQQKKADFEFNGTAVISGIVAVVGVQKSPGMTKILRSADYDTRVLLLNSAGEVIATQCPDANGNYSFTNLPAGTYSIVIERTGYDMTEPVTAELDEGEQVVNVNFTVDEGTQSVQVGITTAIFSQLFEYDKAVNIFPNPVRDVLNVKIDTNGSKQVRIILTDLTGQQVLFFQQNLSPGVNYLTLQNPGLRGMYILTIISDGPKINKRVIFDY